APESGRDGLTSNTGLRRPSSRRIPSPGTCAHSAPSFSTAVYGMATGTPTTVDDRALTLVLDFGRVCHRKGSSSDGRPFRFSLAPRIHSALNKERCDDIHPRRR